MEETMGSCGKKIAAGCILGIASLWGHGAAVAADLVIISGQGNTPEVKELAAAFARSSGNKVTVIQQGGPELEARLNSNAPTDLIAAGPDQIESLIKKGTVVAGTQAPFALAGLGLSVRAGVSKPDIGTVEAYKAALLSAKSIGYSRGCSGTHTAEGIEELGLTQQLMPKTVRTDGGPVVNALAKGDFDLGIQQTNIMVGAPGTEYVGALPGFLNKPCPSSVAVMAGSKQPDAARALIRFMTSPEAAPLLRRASVEPAKP
jgi:molybdate transport system substrate-binding protein